MVLNGKFLYQFECLNKGLKTYGNWVFTVNDGYKEIVFNVLLGISNNILIIRNAGYVDFRIL